MSSDEVLAGGGIKSMISVKRLGHATLATPDIERQADYWTAVMGLQVVHRSKDFVLLATKLGEEAIALEAGPEPFLNRVAFQVEPGSDLGELSAHLQKLGVSTERRTDVTPGIPHAIVFRDPKGTLIEIFGAPHFHARDKSDLGIGTLKLGHVAYRVQDVQKIVSFYNDVLGFRTSDWIGDHFAFLRCGVDHHTVNFVHYDTPALHHIAFEVKDWAELQRGCEILQKHGTQLVWGPLRHIVGHNVAAYHRNPDGVRVEIYCEMDMMKDEALGYWEPRPWHEEIPLRPKKWPKDTMRSAWGFGSFGTFPGYRVGSLTPGMDADVVVLNAGRLNVWPLNNAAGCVVNLMSPANVETVFVGGKLRKSEGRLVGVDEARVKKLAATSRDEVLGRANFPSKLL